METHRKKTRPTLRDSFNQEMITSFNNLGAKLGLYKMSLPETIEEDDEGNTNKGNTNDLGKVVEEDEEDENDDGDIATVQTTSDDTRRRGLMDTKRRGLMDSFNQKMMKSYSKLSSAFGRLHTTPLETVKEDDNRLSILQEDEDESDNDNGDILIVPDRNGDRWRGSISSPSTKPSANFGNKIFK